MKTSESRTLETCRSVQNWMNANDPALGNINQSSERKNLDDAVTLLTVYANDQDTNTTGSKAQTAKLAELRHDLREVYMKPVATTAKEKLQHGVPELSVLRMPSTRATDQTLISHAAAMVNAAAVHKDVFLAAGLATDFDTQLTNAANALKTAVDSRNQSRTLRKGATDNLALERKRAASALRVLSSIVAPRLKDNKLLLAQWTNVSRIKGGSTTSASTATASSTPSAPTVSTTSAPAASPPASAPVAPVAPAPVASAA